jgi:hypothetical protein
VDVQGVVAADHFGGILCGFQGLFRVFGCFRFGFFALFAHRVFSVVGLFLAAAVGLGVVVLDQFEVQREVWVEAPPHDHVQVAKRRRLCIAVLVGQLEPKPLRLLVAQVLEPDVGAAHESRR